MAVSVTYTLEAGYGLGAVVDGAGFLLNNEMGDFNGKPGLTDTDALSFCYAETIWPAFHRRQSCVNRMLLLRLFFILHPSAFILRFRRYQPVANPTIGPVTADVPQP